MDSKEDVAFTCQFTAALRTLEGTSHNPLLLDALAPYLCNERALQLARTELSDLTASQGDGKHLRVPARTKLIDDDLISALAELQATQPASGASQPTVQVVSLGCGMDTRPWRLDMLHAGVAWYDVDLPFTMELKAEYLQAAGAQVDRSGGSTADAGTGAGASTVAFGAEWSHLVSNRCGAADMSADVPSTTAARPHLVSPAKASAETAAPAEALATTAASTSTSLPASSSHNAAPPHPGNTPNTLSHPQHPSSSYQGPRFPLLCHHYIPIAVDLSSSPLSSALIPRGFTPCLPTVWIMEALVYYMPLEAAGSLMAAAAALSGPGSRLIATCIDSDLLEASRSRMAQMGPSAVAGQAQDPPRGAMSHEQTHGNNLTSGACGNDSPDATAPPTTTTAVIPGLAAGVGGLPTAAAAAAPGSRSSNSNTYSQGQGHHVFANLWFFDVDQLLACPGYQDHWHIRLQPATTRSLALQRYQADTYVALYGGAECLFTATVRTGAHQGRAH